MAQKNTTQKIKNSGFSDWSPSQLPDLKDKVYVITGGNTGLGFETAKLLNQAGANIVIASRNLNKAHEAVQRIDVKKNTTIECVQLDLADLNQIRTSAKDFRSRYKKIDGLINNAGIMHTPELQTQDGFELQIGTNHLGHFLWTGLLFDLIHAAKGRIVILSSALHKNGHIHLDNLMLKDNYDSRVAYAQSKLANLMFMLELDRRLKSVNSPVSCYGCHPGYASTGLQTSGRQQGDELSIFLKMLIRVSNALIAQSAEKGAIPTVLCAAGLEAKPGGYYGPQKMGESLGNVSDALVSSQALDEHVAQNLWSASETLVDFKWKIM